jgi:outer membrane protein TolC
MRYKYLSIFLILAAVIAAPAEEPSALAVLLEEARRKNPEILAARKACEAARQKPDQASALPDPMLAAGYTSAGSPRPVAGIGREPVANAGLMISQEFPGPGKRDLRGAVARREAEAAYQDSLQAELIVVSRLKQAWYRLHFLYEIRGVLESNRDLLRKFLRIAEARYAVGRSSQEEIFRLQTQLSILETRLERFDQQRLAREAEINTLAVRPLSAPVPRPSAPVPPALPGFDDLYARIRETSPVLRREEKLVQRSEAALNLARKDYYPDFTLSGGYFNMGAMPDMYEVRVGISLPAYWWRKQRSGVAGQVHELNRARKSYEAARNDLRFRLKQEYLAAQSAARLIAMYETAVGPQAALALQASLPAYETGAAGALPLLANFLAVLDYQVSLHEEKLNYVLALVRMEELTGVRLAEDGAQ